MVSCSPHSIRPQQGEFPISSRKTKAPEVTQDVYALRCKAVGLWPQGQRERLPTSFIRTCEDCDAGHDCSPRRQFVESSAVHWLCLHWHHNLIDKHFAPVHERTRESLNAVTEELLRSVNAEVTLPSDIPLRDRFELVLGTSPVSTMR